MSYGQYEDYGYASNVVTFGDYDNDGCLDAFIGNKGAPNNLVRGLGDGKFEAVTNTKITCSQATGPEVCWDPTKGPTGQPLEAFTTKTAVWGDLDGDGWLDIIIDLQVGSDYGYPKIYRNKQDGTFDQITTGAIARDPLGSDLAYFDTRSVILGDYDVSSDLSIEYP